MINETRNRLTLINYIVLALMISIILLIAFITIFTAISRSIRNEMTYVGALDFQTEFNEESLDHGFFYVEVNNQNQILNKSNNITVNTDSLLKMNAYVLESTEFEGIIDDVDNNNYDYLKLELNDYTRIVYIDVDEKFDVTIDHLTFIPIIWIISLILIYPISRYLAEKSIEPIKVAWNHQLEFTADASHEIRTPITTILTNIELILSLPDETVESNMKWLNNIKFEAKRISILINDLLTLARADSTEKLIEKEEFYLSDAIKSTSYNFEAKAELENYNYKSNIAEFIYYTGDKERIIQLINILLDNAFKYTPISGNISLTIEKGKKDIYIKVSDTGIGIEEEDLDHIFDRFHRQDKARSRNTGGAGLGLSIANWIVHEHGGSIDVKSIPDLGSDFIVKLPIN